MHQQLYDRHIPVIVFLSSVFISADLHSLFLDELCVLG